MIGVGSNPCTYSRPYIDSVVSIMMAMFQTGYHGKTVNMKRCSDIHRTKHCHDLAKCTQSKSHQKTVLKYIWSDYLKQTDDIGHTTGMRELYVKRKETIERCFADAKEKYRMPCTLVRGLSQVRKWVKLKFVTMNIKKYALHIA